MYWRTLAALLVATSSLSLAPMLPVAAQQRFNLNTVQLQQGTVIPVGSVSTSGPEYYSIGTVHNTRVSVAQNIFDSQGRLVLPAGTVINGQLLPVQGGAQFVATSIVANGRTYSVRARSGVIPDEKDPREFSAESIAGDALIGAAAGTLLGALTGGVTTTSVLGGAAAGVITGNVTAPQVVVLRPGRSFNLTLQSPLRF